MPRYEHKKIAEKLKILDILPSETGEIRNWIKADKHLQFLIDTAHSQEFIVYASPEYSFIHTVAVPEKMLEPIDKDDLMRWSMNPYISAASYVTGGGREDMWVEYDGYGAGSKILSKSTQLIYGRTFEGWNGEDSNYFELSQFYAHLEGLHWRPEQRGYCKFDDNGDLVSIVNITRRGVEDSISLVTFDFSSLENYLAASNQVLVRLFDFTLLDRKKFLNWEGGDENIYLDSNEIFYKQKICGEAAYTRGVQIIRPRRTKQQIFCDIEASWYGETKKNHHEFIAHDWRNGCVKKISTDPDATTNYFEAEGNDLPFELSPVFFKPEVLLKYKADKEKYTVSEREIHCRASWFLEAFDVNEAGQVFAYICYLRRLPETELLHWLSYNEEPKAAISERAVINDFQGDFVSYTDPLEKIKHLINDWIYKKYSWWCLYDRHLPDKVSVPLTSSRDEWGEAFLMLTQFIHEGFVIKEIRIFLEENQIEFNKEEKSISLLEKLLGLNNVGSKLNGLRTAQLLRTKLKGHGAKNDAEKLALAALNEHESFAAHFRYICEKIHQELQMIESYFCSYRKVDN